MLRKSVAILFNPISGKGDGKRIARELSDRLISCGMTAFCTESNQSYKEGELLTLIGDVDALVVVGGDGTLDNTGFIVIANAREYALGLDPVPEADSGNPILHARFFPCRSRFDYILWAYRCWRGWQVNTASACLLSGKCFEIYSEDSSPYPVQADGEFIGDTPVKVSVSDDTLNVLA